MTAPMDIPLYGKVKLFETSKSQLLDLWKEVINKNNIEIKENAKVESIVFNDNRLMVQTSDGITYTARKVLLSIGRRGTPRKLNIPGEMSTKVAYRLIEAEDIENKKIMIVGGGDSAIESALLLGVKNQVTLSYRGESFGRIKSENSTKINIASASHQIDVRFNTSLKSIEEDYVNIADLLTEEVTQLTNDLVYVFAGGELPTQFLEKAGIKITKKYGEALLKHH